MTREGLIRSTRRTIELRSCLSHRCHKTRDHDWYWIGSIFPAAAAQPWKSPMHFARSGVVDAAAASNVWRQRIGPCRQSTRILAFHDTQEVERMCCLCKVFFRPLPSFRCQLVAYARVCFTAPAHATWKYMLVDGST